MRNCYESQTNHIFEIKEDVSEFILVINEEAGFGFMPESNLINQNFNSSIKYDINKGLIFSSFDISIPKNASEEDIENFYDKMLLALTPSIIHIRNAELHNISQKQSNMSFI